jgi:hypothetical protein
MTRGRHRRIPARPLVAAWVGLWAVWLTLTSPSALAHGEDGYFDDVSVTTSPTLELAVDALLRYENDDDPAPGATVTLVAEHADGDVVGPVPMRPGEETGRYAATATLPRSGEWTLRLTSLEPDGLLRRTTTVPGDGATGPVRTPTASASVPAGQQQTSSPAGSPPTEGAGTDQPPAAQPTPEAGPTESTASASRTSPVVAVAGGAALLLVLLAAGLALRRRR